MQKFITKNVVKYVLVLSLAPMVLSCKINPSAEFPDPIDVTFLDPNFETLIRETIGLPSGVITNERMWNIKELDGSGRNIISLSGIEHCTGVQNLFLGNNQIKDLDYLSDLPLLNIIDLSNNKIQDLTPLLNNYSIGIGIDQINVNNNPLSDVSIFQRIPQIRKKGIVLNSNAIPAAPGLLLFSDINFEFVIRDHIGKASEAIISSDLDTIINIAGRNKGIFDIYGLEYCKNLKTIDFGVNFITDFSPLQNLTEITRLNLDENNIKNIDNFSNLINLEYLNFNSNSIEDISVVTNFTNLKGLAIGGNPISDLTFLFLLDNLETLGLSNYLGIDINDIHTIKNLKSLILTNSAIINFDSISNITTLENAFLANCKITNINALSDLSQMKRLFLNNNSIDDLAPLENLQQLRELNLGNNNITDILPLVNNVGLQGGNDYVLIHNNPLSEVTINTYIPQLQARGVNVIF